MVNERAQTQYDSRYVANRMARAVGHLKLVRSMVEENADCAEVLVQLAAVRGQLDSICGSILTQYADQFAEEYRHSGDAELLEQFKADLVRAMKK